MLKRALCLVLTVLMLFSLSGCKDIVVAGMFFWLIVTDEDTRAEKGDIFTFVLENEDALRIAIADGNFSAYEDNGIVIKVYAHSRYVEFNCGGYGMGSATAYVGFCYISDNDISAVPHMPDDGNLINPSGAGFVYQQGDDRCYAERICENFYYYEASY